MKGSEGGDNGGSHDLALFNFEGLKFSQASVRVRIRIKWPVCFIKVKTVLFFEIYHCETSVERC